MVLWWECFRLAIRELMRHRGRSLLTSLGVVIGVAAVIGVVSLVQGANAQIQGQSPTSWAGFVQDMAWARHPRPSLNVTRNTDPTAPRQCSRRSFSLSPTARPR